MVRSMRIPVPRRDTVVKLVTRILVETSEEEIMVVMQGSEKAPEEIIEWARRMTSSQILDQRTKWKMFWSLQPPLQ